MERTLRHRHEKILQCGTEEEKMAKNFPIFYDKYWNIGNINPFHIQLIVSFSFHKR